MSNIKYRKSIIDDIPYINNLFIEMIKTVNKRMIDNGIEPYKEFKKGYEDGYLDSFYINENRIIYVALDNDKIIGFISICNYKEEGYIYLDDYIVNEKYRGQGIGTKLMNMSLEYAKESGINKIITHVESANKESISFYKNRGFKLVSEKEHRLLIELDII